MNEPSIRPSQRLLLPKVPFTTSPWSVQTIVTELPDSSVPTTVEESDAAENVFAANPAPITTLPGAVWGLESDGVGDGPGAGLVCDTI
jgi:hypothetical protein